MDEKGRDDAEEGRGIKYVMEERCDSRQERVKTALSNSCECVLETDTFGGVFARLQIRRA